MIEIRDLRGGNFIWVDNEVLDQYDLDPYELSIYAHLCRYAHMDSGTCYPSYETLAKKAKMSRRKVIYVIQSLIAKGLIRKEHQKSSSGDHTSNIYYLLNVKDKEVVNDIHHLENQMHHGVVNTVHPNNTNIINKTNLTRANACSPKKETQKSLPQHSNFRQTQFTDDDYSNMFDNLKRIRGD